MYISAAAKRLYLKISGSQTDLKPVFVLAHGLGTDHRYALLQGLKAKLQRHGTVVQFDFAGYGHSSTGLRFRKVSSYVADLSTVISWLRSQQAYKERQIVVIGHSLGGLATLLKLGQANNGIDAAVLIAVNAQPQRLYQDYLQRGLLKQLKKESHIGRQRVAVDFWKDRKSVLPLKFARRIRKPVLLIYGTEDHINPPAEGRLLYGVIPNRHKKLALIKTDHHFDTTSARNQLYKLLIKWFQTYVS